MKITHTDKEITFTFSRWQDRWNPFQDEGTVGIYPTFTGLIVRHRKNGNNWDEIGFAGTIDMSYKGKADQVSDFLVMWSDDEESFREMCGELDIDIFEMTI